MRTGCLLLAGLTVALLVASPARPLGPPPRPLLDRNGDPLPFGAVARFGSTLQPERQIQHGAAFSPDSRLFATLERGNEGQTVRLWRVKDGRLQGRFFLRGEADGPPGPVFAPDGRTLFVSGSNSREVLQVDVGTGKVLRRFKARKRISCFAVAPDGKTIAVGCEHSPRGGNSIYRWEVATGKSLGEVGQHTAPVETLAFSPDGKRLLSFSAVPRGTPTMPRPEDVPEEVAVWDVASGKRLKKLSPKGDHVRFSPAGDVFLIGSFPDRLELWDLETGKRRATLPGVSDPLYMPGGKTLDLLHENGRGE